MIFLVADSLADVALWYKVDTKLRHVSQSYTNQFFSSSSFSCLPMKVCESEVYAKHIVQPWDMHCTCLFWNNFESWYACSHQKISKATSYTWNQGIEWLISSNLKICITNIKQNFKIIAFFKNISLVYQFKLMSDIFKQEISDFWSMPSFLRYTNVDLKISLYFCFHIKITAWTFLILNPTNSQVICP